MTSVVLESEFNRVREFYRLTGYTGDVQFGDVVVGAWRETDLVGVVRIATEEGVRVRKSATNIHSHQKSEVSATRFIGETPDGVHHDGYNGCGAHGSLVLRCSSSRRYQRYATTGEAR